MVLIGARKENDEQQAGFAVKKEEITSGTLDLRNCKPESTTFALLAHSELQGSNPIPN